MWRVTVARADFDDTRVDRKRRRGWFGPIRSLLLALGGYAAAVALFVWSGGSGQMLVVAGVTDLTFVIVLLGVGFIGVVGLLGAAWRWLVSGYELVTATLAALFVIACAMAAVVVTGFAGFLVSVAMEGSHEIVDAPDRPMDRQVLVWKKYALSETYWHVYVGGPFLYTEVTDETFLNEDCSRPGANRRQGEEPAGYTLVTDEHGRDILTIPVEYAHCDSGGEFRFAIPE
ncbi:hypothetical protein [Myceligenerans indicum]|uniref:Uncharacterized protein n=1 Tax=Myceligenerans indicum TaxID=2593663 RepID=A0ABS1LRQ9_9MICO|nr:hypothetical protein [Myceligenerans indicum]MBL0888905.1 hypothetical protein [Myceligenerans indicum]